MKCQRCGNAVQSYSKMRKWCFECRRALAVERARERKQAIGSGRVMTAKVLRE